MYKYLLIILLLITSCSKKAEIPSIEMERNSGADEIIDNLLLIASSGEKIEWQMNAGQAQRFLNYKLLIAYKVFVESLNMEDKNYYSSDSAYVHEITDEFIGMGNVELITPKGILRTDKITWNRKTNMIHAPNQVYIKRYNHEMWGENLYTNSNLDFINMEKVSGTGVVDEKIFDD